MTCAAGVYKVTLMFINAFTQPVGGGGGITIYSLSQAAFIRSTLESWWVHLAL